MSSVREVRLPALSATMEEATLLEWKVSPGDTVTEGQPIAEVSTDKVDMDLEAPFAGVIHQLLAQPGEAVPLGGTLATIETEAEDLLGGLDLGSDGPTGAASDDEPEALSQEPEAQIAASTEPPEAAAGGIVAASPPARKMARELGIDLASVTASGARGQVTPADVKRHAEAGTPAPTAPPPTPASSVSSPDARVLRPDATMDDAKRLSVRRATADIMGHSAAIPQFTLWRTLVLDRAARTKGGLSWTTVLARGLAASLAEHPELNARWDEEGRAPVPFEAVRIGLAVDRPGTGLVVVAVQLPDDPEQADRAVRSAADRAKTGKLRPEDLAQASITLSNLGGLGVDRFNALLFPPQPAIVSAGSIRNRPIATGDGALKAALTCEVGLTVDHRVADGADGARFLETFASAVEAG